MLALSKRKTHEISRSDNWNGFKNQAEKTLKLDANINKQVKFEIKHTMLFTLASPKIKCMHASHSLRSTSLLPHELQPSRFLCPWNFPGKNTVVGCHFLLQGIYPSQESNPCLQSLLDEQADSLPLSLRSPKIKYLSINLIKSTWWKLPNSDENNQGWTK